MLMNFGKEIDQILEKDIRLRILAKTNLEIERFLKLGIRKFKIFQPLARNKDVPGFGIPESVITGRASNKYIPYIKSSIYINIKVKNGINKLWNAIPEMGTGIKVDHNVDGQMI